MLFHGGVKILPGFPCFVSYLYPLRSPCFMDFHFQFSPVNTMGSATSDIPEDSRFLNARLQIQLSI